MYSNLLVTKSCKVGIEIIHHFMLLVNHQCSKVSDSVYDAHLLGSKTWAECILSAHSGACTYWHNPEARSSSRETTPKPLISPLLKPGIVRVSNVLQ